MRMRAIVAGLGLILGVQSCVSVAPKALWDKGNGQAEPAHVGNFYATTILKEDLNSDVWYTPNSKCISIRSEDSLKNSGEKSIFIRWDKQGGGCDWVGMGIGWDAWSSKDLSSIKDSACLQFRIYSTAGKISSLPLAAGLEDYYGNQAWTGLGADKVHYVGEEKWAYVRIPLSEFNWKENNADPSAIKQFVIQFEVAGELYFDDFEIVALP
ncbi:MAG: hypothetical protein ACOVQJ_00525 [Bacteroidia bacterium]|jgi:hypothetical protein